MDVVFLQPKLWPVKNQIVLSMLGTVTWKISGEQFNLD